MNTKATKHEWIDNEDVHSCFVGLGTVTVARCLIGAADADVYTRSISSSVGPTHYRRPSSSLLLFIIIIICYNFFNSAIL